jgi:uridine kinase
LSQVGSFPSFLASTPLPFQDSFYKPHGPEELKLAFENKYDFDDPDALDLDLFAEVGFCAIVLPALN